jgi:hypothetical protein
MGASRNYDLSICLLRSSTRPRPTLVGKLTKVLWPARCSRSSAALVPHDRSSGLARLLQQIISERKGRAQQLQSARDAVLGKGFCGGDEKVGFSEKILEGL